MINITEYQVGPGAYGVAISADGSVWTSLVDRGALARVSPDGQASQLQLDSAQSRPMVLTQGPDGTIWFTRGDGLIGRIAADGGTTSLPVRTPTGDAWSLVGEGARSDCLGSSRTTGGCHPGARLALPIHVAGADDLAAVS
jgi:hypothetical protein